MFGDPIAFLRNAVTKNLARIKAGDQESSYMSSDQNFILEISHQTTKVGRERTTLRFTERKTVTDPLTAQSDYDSATFTFTIDRPGYGFSDVELYYDINALMAFLSQANVTKLVGHES
jgi:hypothetical protein